MHPATKRWHMIDYALVNRKYRSSVEDVRMLRKAAGTIGTDHHLMRVKIKFHLRSRRKMNNVKKTKYDPTKMKDNNALKQFQLDINSTLGEILGQSISAEEKYLSFVEFLKENAEKHFKLDKNFNKKRKEWLTDEILQLVDKKALAFVDWQNSRGTPAETTYKNKYRRLRKVVKTKTDQRQTEYWDEVCEEIEGTIKLNDPATAFAIIRRLRGGNKRVENMPIKDKNGALLVNSTDRLQRWREYFDELLNVPSAVDQVLIDSIPESQLTRSEEKRQSAVPTIQEVETALKQMKSRKAPGDDGV
ncbi:unnamed protein product, partial [Didymodactylos carnosus]